MGEARRRKLAGTSQKPNDPLEAARRFWCGRNPIAAADFVAHEGTVAITFDVQGVHPATCSIDAAQLVPLLDGVAEYAARLSYYGLVRHIAGEFTKAKRTGDDGPFQWIGIAGLWTAFNHPKSGDAMRQAVSENLRQDGKAHISWHYGPNGLGMALSKQFVDLEPMAAVALKDRVTTYTAPDAKPQKPGH